MKNYKLTNEYTLHPGWINLIYQTSKEYNIQSSVYQLRTFLEEYQTNDIRLQRKLHQHAVTLSNNLLFPVEAAKYVTPFTFGCYSVALWSAPNVYQLLRDFTEYFAIISSQLKLKMIEHNDKVEIWLIKNSLNTHSEVSVLGVMTILSTLLSIIKKTTNTTLPPSLYYTYDQTLPQDKRKIVEQEFNSHLIFSNSRRLVFNREDLNQPLIHSNNEVYQSNLATVKKEVARINKTDVVIQLHAIFSQAPTLQDMKLKKAATLLYTSPRTLNRKLAERDCTFKSVLNKYRLEVALQMLKESNTPLNTIAFVLGFSEVSSFSRAFKHWTGYNPSQLR